MQITKLFQNNSLSGFAFIFVFAITTALITIPDSNLEQRVTDLENRVDSLEEAVLDNSENEEASEVKVKDKALSITNWRQLKTGMSYDDVRELLGEPEKVDGGNVASWKYPSRASVTFIDGEVFSWSEPAL